MLPFSKDLYELQKSLRILLESKKGSFFERHYTSIRSSVNKTLQKIKMVTRKFENTSKICKSYVSTCVLLCTQSLYNFSAKEKW
jgi:hypothetical protein